MQAVTMVRLRRFSLPESERLDVLYTLRRAEERQSQRCLINPQPSSGTGACRIHEVAHVVSDQFDTSTWAQGRRYGPHCKLVP